MCASTSREPKFFPLLRVQLSTPEVLVLRSKGCPPRWCCASSGPVRSKRMRGGRDLGSLAPRCPLYHKVIQMLVVGGGIRNTERTAGQMVGLQGRAGCALAGPHPVALICFFCFFFPSHQSFSLSLTVALPLICRCCHTSNPAFHSLFNSIFSLSLSICSHSITGGAACESW